MITTVVFDLGMVLSNPPQLLDVVGEALGAEPEALDAVYWNDRAAYDSGTSAAEHWGAIAGALQLELTDEQLEGVARADALAWMELRPDARALLRDCQANGYRVAILTNSPRIMEQAIADAEWSADVDHVFVSAVLGVAKPDPRLYQHVTTVLGVEAHTIAFVDDKQDNVDGARNIGWEAHLWRDDADTRAWLQDLGVLARN